MKKILICNDFTKEVCINFANPKSPSMLGIMQLHDHIMFFITLVLFLKLFFYIECIYESLNVEVDVVDLLINYSAIEWSNNNLRRILLFYLMYKVKIAKNMKMNVYEHNPELEFIWTISPAIVLLLMALPSLYLLYSLESSPKPIYTIMVIGNQWYWTYQYVDFDVQATFVEVVKDQILNSSKTLLDKSIVFNIDDITKDAFNFAKKKITKCLSTDSLPVPDTDLPSGHPRLLSVDQPLFLPSNTEIRLLITSADVIHSWAVPSLGIKMDAIPGRLNQVIFKTPFSGTCWGQCSEICGVNHVIMPIEVRIVSLKDFEALLHVYLRDYLKAPVKEFMEMFYSKYYLNGKKIKYTFKNYNKLFFNFNILDVKFSSKSYVNNIAFHEKHSWRELLHVQVVAFVENWLNERIQSKDKNTLKQTTVGSTAKEAGWSASSEQKEFIIQKNLNNNNLSFFFIFAGFFKKRFWFFAPLKKLKQRLLENLFEYVYILLTLIIICTFIKYFDLFYVWTEFFFISFKDLYNGDFGVKKLNCVSYLVDSFATNSYIRNGTWRHVYVPLNACYPLLIGYYDIGASRFHYPFSMLHTFPQDRFNSNSLGVDWIPKKYSFLFKEELKYYNKSPRIMVWQQSASWPFFRYYALIDPIFYENFLKKDKISPYYNSDDLPWYIRDTHLFRINWFFFIGEFFNIMFGSTNFLLHDPEPWFPFEWKSKYMESTSFTHSLGITTWLDTALWDGERNVERYFPHYTMLLSNSYSIPEYLALKETSFMPNIESSSTFWFSGFSSIPTNLNFTEIFPFLRGGINWRRNLNLPFRFAPMEIYKYYALDDDSFYLNHGYYKEIPRYYRMNNYYSMYPYRVSANYSRDLLQSRYAWVAEAVLHKYVIAEDTQDPEMSIFRKYSPTVENRHIYSKQALEEFSEYKQLMKTFSSKVSVTSHKTTPFEKVIIYLVTYYRPSTSDRKYDKIRNAAFKLCFEQKKKVSAPTRSILWKYMENQRKKLMEAPPQPGYPALVNINRLYPNTKDFLAIFSLRNFISKEKVDEGTQFNNIDPIFVGLSGLIEMSATLKKLKSILKKNKDYVFCLDGHFHDFQLRWMWQCNELINEKVKLVHEDFVDLVKYKRWKSRMRRAYVRRLKRKFKNHWMYASNMSRRAFMIKKRFRLFGYRTRVESRYKWHKLYSNYTYASKSLFEFLENPILQKTNRIGFLNAIDTYYYSLKNLIRTAWRNELGQVNRIRHLSWNKQPNVNFMYQKDRMAPIKLIRKYLRIPVMKTDEEQRQLGRFRLEVAMGNKIMNKLTTKGNEYKTRTWSMSKWFWKIDRWRRKKARINRFYKNLEDTIVSRNDFPFYSLATQHVFTRIARTLTIFNLPKYKKSDFIFEFFAFRNINIRKSKRQLIVDYLNNFTDEEIERVWPNFNIRIINYRFSLERANSFSTFLRKLIFNRIYDFTINKWSDGDEKKDITLNDRKKFLKIWNLYREIFIDTLFINQIYDLKWKSKLHSNDQIILHALNKYLETFENHFLNIFFSSDYNGKTKHRRIDFMFNKKILNINTSKHESEVLKNYFQKLLLIQEPQSKIYENSFYAFSCLNPNFVEENLNNIFSSPNFFNIEYTPKGCQSVNFLIFIKMYTVYTDLLNEHLKNIKVKNF